MKKLEIEQTKPTFIISVLKVPLISSFFITRMSLANKWMRKKIPSLCNFALVGNTSIEGRHHTMMGGKYVVLK